MAKTRLLWRSEERELEVRINFQQPHNLIEEYLQANHGKPATLILEDTRLNVILIGGSKSLLFMRRHPERDWVIVPLSKVVAICTDVDS